MLAFPIDNVQLVLVVAHCYVIFPYRLSRSSRPQCKKMQILLVPHVTAAISSQGEQTWWSPAGSLSHVFVSRYGNNGNGSGSRGGSNLEWEKKEERGGGGGRE